MSGFIHHVIVVLTLSLSAMILVATVLNFLGLDLRPLVLSWGMKLQETIELQAVANFPWLLMPMIPIIVTILPLKFLGNGMRDAADFLYFDIGSDE